MVFIETLHLISVLMYPGESQSLELCNKSLIRDGQQFRKYQQNEQPHLTWNHWTQ